MKDILEQVKASYNRRTAEIEEQKRIWIALSESYPPDLSLFQERPSEIIAGETGDLGLSVLWIVQAALIKPLLDEIISAPGVKSELPSMIGRHRRSAICALASSESPDEPAILTQTGNGVILNGIKKYITGGKSSGMIIVTCRMPGEVKISRFVLMETADIQPGSLPELNLEIMKSVSHTSLILKNTVVRDFQVPDIEPSLIRRMLKKYGMLERSLILEAYLSYLLYAENVLNAAGGEIKTTEEISLLADAQSASVSKQIDEAFSGERIVTENIPFHKILPLIELFKKTYLNCVNNLPEEEKIKLKDLFLFNSLKG